MWNRGEDKEKEEDDTILYHDNIVSPIFITIFVKNKRSLYVHNQSRREGGKAI